MSEMTIESIERCLDLKDVLKKAAENHGWTDNQAKLAYQGYVQHWYLAVKYPAVPLAAISKSADDLWHQHIIDTRRYMLDCQQILGTYLHHQPIYGTPTAFEQAAYDQTVELYQREFGVLPTDLAVTSGNYSYRPVS